MRMRMRTSSMRVRMLRVRVRQGEESRRRGVLGFRGTSCGAAAPIQFHVAPHAC